MECERYAGYHDAMTQTISPVGDLLRQWRQRRRLSQLALSCEAEVSTRHLSFVESGRAQPSRDMVLHLAEQLDVPLRERNHLLIAAGYAPVFEERTLDDPALTTVRRVVEQILTGHEPYPALAIDRHWNLVAANQALMRLLTGVSAELLQPPINVLRLSLHPDGVAPRIANLPQWRAHLLARLRHQIEVSRDAALASLLEELQTYPIPQEKRSTSGARDEFAGIAVPLQIRTDAGVLSFLSTTTVFGTPVDVTVSEIALETFYPANAECATALQRLPN